LPNIEEDYYTYVDIVGAGDRLNKEFVKDSTFIFPNNEVIYGYGDELVRLNKP